MGVPISFAEAVTAPAGTGTTLVPTIPSHQEDDVLILQAGWKGNQAPTALTGWTLYFSQATGTATTGCGQGVWWRRVAPSETVTSPTLTIGTTAVERRGIVYCIRGADIDNPSNTFWQKQQTVGNSAAPTPPSITTLAPNYLLLHLVTCRGNSAVTPPTGYNEEQDTAEGTTICVEGSTLTQTNAATVSGQAASISSNRWVAAIIAIPSPDYPYFRSQTSQTATATSVTGTLPTGTTAADFYGRKDLIIATVEAPGTAPSPNVGADWTEIATWSTTTSGGATTVRRYWALYDGSISLQFNRSGSGEISLQLCTYRNPHQTAPIGNVNVRQNASSTTSTWDALTRSATKSTVNASCVADATPTYTSPAGWTERSDGNGISTADQIFEATGSTASASFTLSTASPTAVGLVEILSHAGVSPTILTPANASLTTTPFAPALKLAIVPPVRSSSLATFAPTISTGAGATTVTPDTQALNSSIFAPKLVTGAIPGTQTLTLTSFAPALALMVTPSQQALSLTSFAPSVVVETNLVPVTLSVTATRFAPSLNERATPQAAALAASTFAPKLASGLVPSTVSLSTTGFSPQVLQGANTVPATASLSINTFAPNLITITSAQPSTATLTTNTFAPKLSTSLVPPTKSLSVATFAPQLTQSVSVIPATTNLTTAHFAPQLIVKTTPPTQALTLSTFAPTITVEGGLVPNTASLTITSFVPALQTAFTPGVNALSVGTFAPAVTIGTVVVPASTTLSLTRFASSLAHTISLQSTALVTTRFVPDVYAGGPGTYVPSTANLTLSMFAPLLVQYAPRRSINIPAQNRTISIGAENRTVMIPAEE